MTYIPVGGLSIAKPLYDLINDKAAPQTGVNATDFWAALERILGELTPLNRSLLDQMDEQMALLVQRVSGAYHRHYFFPEMAGVGLSHNPFVWKKGRGT